MEIATKIKNRYEKLFHPALIRWLTCYANGNIKNCRCLDVIELNAAMLIYSIMYTTENDISVEFDVAEPYDFMVYNEQLYSEINSHYGVNWEKGNCVPDLPSIRHKLKESDAWNAQEECDMLRDQDDAVIVLFVAFCLYLANADPDSSRNIIQKWLLMLNPNVLSAYVEELSKVPEEDWDQTQYQKHLNVLLEMLKIVSEKETVPIEDILHKVVLEPNFRTNYGLDEIPINIPELIRRSIIPEKADSAALRLVNSNGVSLIAGIVGFVKMSEHLQKTKELKADFIKIDTYMNELVWRLRRHDEPEILSKMKELDDFIDNI